MAIDRGNEEEDTYRPLLGAIRGWETSDLHLGEKERYVLVETQSSRRQKEKAHEISPSTGGCWIVRPAFVALTWEGLSLRGWVWAIGTLTSLGGILFRNYERDTSHRSAIEQGGYVGRQSLRMGNPLRRRRGSGGGNISASGRKTAARNRLQGLSGYGRRGTRLQNRDEGEPLF